MPPDDRVDRTVGDRVAAHAARRAEVGPLPAVADPERREACRMDLILFGVTYCMRSDDWPGLLLREPSSELREYARDLQAGILGAGLLHIRLPRGAGKTTWAKIALLWAVLYGHLTYPVCFAASERLSNAILSDIWDALEFSPLLGDDFPEVCVPVRSLEGKFQRAASQTLDGIRTSIRRTADLIQMPTVVGSPSSGSILSARGAGAAVRGLVRRGMRPDFVLLDDIQTREDAASDVSTRKLIAWVLGDVLGLAGSRHISAVMTTTPIQAHDFSERFADSEQFPAWQTTSHPLVRRWPEAEGLWDEYAELWRSGIRDDGDPAPATAFYLANRDEMDAGAVVFDEGNFDERFEVSGIQHAMNLRLRNGEEAFASEYMLTPPKLATMFVLKAREVAAKVNRVPRYVLPAGTLVPVAFIDVMAEAGVFWAVLGCGRKQTGAVIDYGRYPERGRLVPESAPDRDIERIVAQAVGDVLARLFGREYMRESDGRPMPLYAAWVDDGWKTDVVRRVCAMYRRRGHSNVWSCKGWPSDKYNDGQGKNVVSRGFQSDLRESNGVRFAGQNSDFWREQSQRCFLGEALQPGTLSLWGDDSNAHGEFGEHMTANVLADKAKSPRGVDLYRWTRRPGGVDHWHDCVGGALAVASYYRFWDGKDVVTGAVPVTASLPIAKDAPAGEAAAAVARGRRSRGGVGQSRRKWRSASPVE